MTLPEMERTIDELFRGVNGMQISYDARNKLDSWYFGQTYGEVTFGGFARMLAAARPQEGEVFYDLGSGVGKPVYMASLLAPFKKAVGIELLQELHDQAVALLPKYQELAGPQFASLAPVSFIRGSFKEVDFSDADVIFMNATCFHYEFDPQFVAKFEALKKGSRVIISSMHFVSDRFLVRSLGPHPFSWGDEEVFLLEKK